jgi:hypothetical protein
MTRRSFDIILNTDYQISSIKVKEVINNLQGLKKEFYIVWHLILLHRFKIHII